VLPGHRRAAVPPTNPCANRCELGPHPALLALLRGNVQAACHLPCQQAFVASMSKQSDCFLMHDGSRYQQVAY
jgi:hypothetical protein